jgi:hypothetical protein
VVTPAPQVATAQSLLALPQAPVRIREVPEDDAPTGSFPRVDGDSGAFAAAPPGPRTPAPVSPAVGFPAVPGRRVPAPTATGSTRVSTTGGYSTGARIATLGTPPPRTPGRGLPHTDAHPDAHADVLTRGVTDTGPRHAVRR